MEFVLIGILFIGMIILAFFMWYFYDVANAVLNLNYNFREAIRAVSKEVDSDQDLVICYSLLDDEYYIRRRG